MKNVENTSPNQRTGFQRTLLAARQGDGEAIGRLFEEFYPRVQMMVHRSLAKDLRSSRPWLTSRFSTGDVVQEVFRSVLQDIRAFGGRTEDAFSGYLAMIVRNRLIDAIRFHEAARRDGRRAARTPQVEVLIETEGPVVEEHNSEGVVEAFHLALMAFPERERLLLRARIEQGETFQVLADQLGYASAGIARRAFYSSQALLLVRLQKGRRQNRRETDGNSGGVHG